MTRRTKRRWLGVLLVAAIVLAASPAFASDYMKNIMKELNKIASAGAAQKVSVMLTVISGLGPEEKEFDQWEIIAMRGAAAAKRGDMAGAKSACNACHDKYREAYKAKFGSGQPTPGPNPVPQPSPED